MSTPTAEDVRKVCGRHGRKPAVATCASCGAAICRACLVPTSVGMKCTSCTGHRGPPRDTGRRSPNKLVVAGAAAVLVLAAGAVLASTLGGGDGADGADAAGTAPIVDSGPADRQVQIDGAGDVKLSATLSLPERAAPGSDLAAVVILGGFGPTDRDGRAADGGVPDNLYRELSDELVEAGLVSLRYDKRGTGRSVLPAGEALRFDDMVTDAGVAVAFLADRAEVDPERIAVVGHEEGGLVAMQLAAAEPRVGGLALISTPGRPLLEVLADDFILSEHQADVEGLRAVVGSLLADGELPEDIPPSLAGYFPIDNEEYLLDIFSVDPVALARDVHVPVLLVRGDEATLVTAEDEAALVSALGMAPEVLVVPDAGPTLAIEHEEGTSGTMPDASDEHSPAVGTTTERATVAFTRIAAFLVAVTES
ncbi:MAG: alpha/beta hydrolase [Acidimicrobiales bacterium]